MTTINRQITVVDEFGYPVSKAHIYFSTNKGVTTDNNGKANLIGDAWSKVTVSHVGKKSVEHTFQNIPATIVLYEEFEGLDEVVITAPKPSGAATDSKVPNYLFPAIGALALLLILMQSTGGTTPKEITL